MVTAGSRSVGPTVGFEVDHVFVAATPGAPGLDDVVAAGFAEAPSNVHDGQGTACRRVFFANAYLELIWLTDPEVAAAPPVARTALAARAHPTGAASHVGICLRPTHPVPSAPPVATWPYRPPYLPPGLAIPVGANSERPEEPLIFFLPAGVAGPRQAPPHPNGARSVTKLRLTLPRPDDPSPELRWLAASRCLDIRYGAGESLAIEVDEGTRGGSLEIAASVPLALTW